jgi:hypothetical protein
LAYVTDEEVNLQICAFALNSIIICNGSWMFKPFDGTYLGDAFSKVY